jgi:hypothetical protein
MEQKDSAIGARLDPQATLATVIGADTSDAPPHVTDTVRINLEVHHDREWIIERLHDLVEDLDDEEYEACMEDWEIENFLSELRKASWVTSASPKETIGEFVERMRRSKQIGVGFPADAVVSQRNNKDANEEWEHHIMHEALHFECLIQKDVPLYKQPLNLSVYPRERIYGNLKRRKIAMLSRIRDTKRRKAEEEHPVSSEA